MKMQFIDLIDAKGRASHLAVNDTDGPEFLRVGGVLQHGAMIRPRTATDAVHLIEWTRQHFGLSDPAADLAALRSALDCLLRLTERAGLCPPGQKRCEMDMAREALARTERRPA